MTPVNHQVATLVKKRVPDEKDSSRGSGVRFRFLFENVGKCQHRIPQNLEMCILQNPCCIIFCGYLVQRFRTNRNASSLRVSFNS